jgi:hypothetical protein
MRRTSAWPIITSVAILMAAGIAIASAQQKKTPDVPPAPDPFKTAKTVFLKQEGGSAIPFNVITTNMEGWERFTLVDAPEKADIILAVTSPREVPDMAVASPIRDYPQRQRTPDQPTPTSRNNFTEPVKLVAYDRKTMKPIWTASHRPHYAVKLKARESSLVEAAEGLFSKFHDRVEPAPKL